MKALSTEHLRSILFNVYTHSVIEMTDGKASLDIIFNDAQRLAERAVEFVPPPTKQAYITLLDECVMEAVKAWRREQRKPSWRIGESSDLAWWDATA